MENASKALLIAGAILIVIALISVGVLIISRMSGVTDEAGSEAERMAIETFNKKFEPYIGDKISASQTRQLFSVINTNNATNANKINFGTGSITKAKDISSTETYNIKTNDTSLTNGYITEITITKN